MRVLATSVLAFEAIVVALGIPVAVRLGPAAGHGATPWVGALLVLLCIVAAAMVTRPVGVALGWAVQGLVLAAGLLVPAFFLLGLVFGSLWWAAVHFGRKADALDAARAAARDAGQGPGPPGATGHEHG